MKFFLGTLAFLLCYVNSFSQIKKHAFLSGVVVDAQTKKPVAGAAITTQNRTTITGDDGHFIFMNLITGNTTVVVNSIGFEVYKRTIQIPQEGQDRKSVV